MFDISCMPLGTLGGGGGGERFCDWRFTHMVYIYITLSLQ